MNEQLRKILAIKRYEVPPPGYFNQLPNRIMARLYAEVEKERLPWFQRWWLAVESRPAFAGAFGLVMCGILVGGVIYSESPSVNQASGSSAQPSFPMLASPQSSGSSWGAPAGLGGEPSTLWHVSEAQSQNISLDIASSTNPLVDTQPGMDLFDYRGFSTPVSYPSGN